MADSQAQPNWLSGLMQGLLGKIGLSGAAAQGGPSTAPATPPRNPWVLPDSPAPSTAQDPNAAAIQQGQTGLQTLQSLWQSLMGKGKQGNQ